MNVALGSATANVASLLDAFATMHVPQISVYTSEELIPKIQEEIDNTSKYYVMKQPYSDQDIEQVLNKYSVQ